MSILDKPLTPRTRRSRWRVFLSLGILLILLITLFVFTDVRADIAMVVHFVSAPNHFTYSGHSNYVSAVAWSPDGTCMALANADGTVDLYQARGIPKASHHGFERA